MPRVIVATDDPEGTATHTEWVSPADFETEHFRNQLAERLAWAVSDASEAEPRVTRQAPPPDTEAEPRVTRHASPPDTEAEPRVTRHASPATTEAPRRWPVAAL